MARTVTVALLPELARDDQLAGATAVIIDVLRASTTICAALHHGATAVTPYLQPDDALRAKATSQAIPPPVLGGERGGVRIAGFDLGNSPFEYTQDAVANRNVFFSTTNGTRAALRCLGASSMAVGCFANLSAITDHLRQSAAPVALVCAGTSGRITMEDCLFAGVAMRRLVKHGFTMVGDDQTLLVQSLTSDRLGTDETQFFSRVHAALGESSGGRNLIDIGFAADVEFCARFDTCRVVPVFDTPSQSFRVMSM